MGDHVRREREKALEMADSARPGTVGALIAEIAKVLAQENVPAADERKDVLELTTAGQDRLGSLVGEWYRQRHVASRAAQKDRALFDASGDGIVAAHLDRAIVSQEDIRDTAEPVHGVPILERDGLVAAVPARHDQRAADPLKEQMLERRVWQHQAEVAQPRSHFLGHALANLRRVPFQ